MSGNNVARLESLSIPEPNSGCWLWLGTCRSNGRGMVYGYIWSPDRRRDVRAHRFSYELFKGQIPSKMLVCHACDNPLCVNPDHLFIGSPKDNADDRDRKGRTKGAPGERNGNSKITASQASHVKWLLANKSGRYRAIAQKAGVTVTIVQDISDGRSWANVEPKLPETIHP